MAYVLRNNRKFPVILGIPRESIEEKSVRRLVRDEEGKETTAVETIETIVPRSQKYHLPESLPGQDPGELRLTDEEWDTLVANHPAVESWCTRKSQGGLGWIDMFRVSVDK